MDVFISIHTRVSTKFYIAHETLQPLWMFVKILRTDPRYVQRPHKIDNAQYITHGSTRGPGERKNVHVLLVFGIGKLGPEPVGGFYVILAGSTWLEERLNFVHDQHTSDQFTRLFLGLPSVLAHEQ